LAISDIPEFIRECYEIKEWRHASAILQNDFSPEWNDIVEVLTEFRLFRSEVVAKGGRKSRISGRLDGAFYDRGWEERAFDTRMVIDTVELDSPTHKVDCYKNRVALEVEWNNKDPFYDRDLNNFRLLFELRAISVGVIVTRTDELQNIFDNLGKGSSYGASTTHMGKLRPRIEGGGGGGCPILVFGISPKLYVEDEDTSSEPGLLS
jgi:hypothetical protein